MEGNCTHAPHGLPFTKIGRHWLLVLIVFVCFPSDLEDNIVDNLLKKDVAFLKNSS